MTLLRLLHSDTVTIVPQWDCYHCSTVRLLQLLNSDTVTIFLNWTVTIVLQWHCYDCSTVTLLQSFHSDTVTIVPQWQCYDCCTVALLRLLHSDTVMIVPQGDCYDCSTVRALRYKFYGLLTLFHNEIHCWRMATCTRNTTHDPKTYFTFYFTLTLLLHTFQYISGLSTWFPITARQTLLSISMFKIDNKNTRTRYETCLK